MNSRKNWRTHRFAPLSQITVPAVWGSGAPVHTSAPLQTAMAEGFQRGVERGYREGHGNGMRSGIDAGIAEGRDAGRREGSEEGRREALLRFEGLAAPLDAMLAALQTLQTDYQAALRKEVVELVAKVAREVIRAELELKPAQMLTLVDETLAGMPRTPKKDVQVYLNKQDFERIRELDAKAVRRWNLSVDDRLEPGECRIKAGNREADAGCRQRLAACMQQVSAQLLPDEGAEQPASI